MSSFLQLCKKMCRDLGLKNVVQSVENQTGMNQKIVDWIADADEEIQTLWVDWNFLWTSFSTDTVVGQLSYSPPSDIGTWDMESFYLDYSTDDYTKLNNLGYLEWRSIHRQGTQTNDAPNSFVLAPDGDIYLNPKPNAIQTLTADYWKAPTRMTLNTDTSDIPERFERIIISRAKIYYAEHEEFPTVFELATREFQGLLMRLESAELPDKTSMRKSRNHDNQMVIRPE